MLGSDGLRNIYLVIRINNNEGSLDAWSVSGVLNPSHVSTRVTLTVIYEAGATVIRILQVRIRTTGGVGPEECSDWSSVM